MSLTPLKISQEKPLENLARSHDPRIQASLHLTEGDLEDIQRFPPSYLPCLDARSGRNGHWQSTEVPFKDIASLRSFCDRYRVSPLSVLQAAWALVLRCYIGDPYICFVCFSSTKAAGTIHREFSDTFEGVCEAHWDGEMSVLEFLRAVSTRDGRKVSQALKTSLSLPSGQPQNLELVPANTGIVFQEDSVEEWVEIDGSESGRWRGDVPIEVQAIVNVRISQKNFLAWMEYSQSTLSVISAMNVAHVYSMAIQEILKDPARSVKAVDLLSSRDLEQLRVWNYELPSAIESCVHELILHHAQVSPQAPAINCWDGDVTYQQLDDLSSCLACEFITEGIQSETLVPVCLEKSLYAAVAMLAVLRAGAAFVPLDPSHPEARFKAIIEKANAKNVVTSSETACLFHHLPVKVIEVSPSRSKPDYTLLDRSLPTVRPYHAAFVLFTSGSTGTPKGIVQEHASVCTNATAQGRAMNITPDSRVFQYAAFTFDVSMMDIFTTLICGGCVCIPSETDRTGVFTSAMNRMRVNWVLFTPSVASLIQPEDVPTLKTLVLGGEAVKQENVSRWAKKVCLLNCYGPAECGACAIGRFTQSDSRPGNVGRHFGAELCWVVDPENHNRLVPIGAVGELVVEGPTLARAYLDDPDKTRAVFIKSPGWPQELGYNRPQRVYKTGDLVRQNSNGTFDFVGRKDLQVKVRGQRVEIGEVEHHVSTYPGIALSMVTRPQSGPYAQTLVALVQLVRGHDPTQAVPVDLDHLPEDQVMESNFQRRKMLQYLASALPSYMVPTHALVVTKLPLSVSGKIDRKTVDTWLLRTLRPAEPVNPSRAMESLLRADDHVGVELCSKVLTLISEPGSAFFRSLSGTNFFLANVGLDSIKIIHLIMFIRQRFGIKVPLNVLMEPTASIRSVSDVVLKLQGYGQTAANELEYDRAEVFRILKQTALEGVARMGTAPMNVFLTGSTGFLGVKILRQLCREHNINRVVVLVRGHKSLRTLDRVVQSARMSGWWTDHCADKLEAWTGCLAKPKLGLKAEQWKRLCGQGTIHERITAIVHNGATVNWNASFSALKAVNVDSTSELLKAAAESASLTKFVFVSGGLLPKVATDDDAAIADEVCRSNGYAQTKFVSELMIKEYARLKAPSQQRVSIIKPGYIIGDKEDGIAATGDFLWRLTASCAAINSYGAEDPDSWLFVSDVDRVATVIKDCCCGREPARSTRGAEVMKILDGLTVVDFWATVQHHLGIELRPLTAGTWIQLLYNSIETHSEQHPLWPLLQTIEQGQGRLGVACTPPEIHGEAKQRISIAIARNIEYLTKIGFLSKPDKAI